MTTKEFRASQGFLRNGYGGSPFYNMPTMEGQSLPDDVQGVIAWSDIKGEDTLTNRKKGVHFFVDDYRFESVFAKPERKLKSLSQYAFVLTPDYSLYKDMPRAIQIYNVFRNRWMGCYYQSKGLRVIPTVSWSDALSFDYCFAGVPKNATVAVSTVGCKMSSVSFMRGYNEMLKRLKPREILVFGSLIDGMRGPIRQFDYIQSRRNG